MLDFEHIEHLPAMFLMQTERLQQKIFLARKTTQGWQKFSYQQTQHAVLNLAASLLRNGLQQGDRVTLLSDNSPEWIIADLAILCAGAIPVPHYTNYTEESHHHCLHDADSVMAFVSSEKLLDSFWGAAVKSNVKHIYLLETTQKKPDTHVTLHDWKQAMAQTLSHEDNLQINQRLSKIERNDIALISYTSGTNGLPKGVMLPHRAILHNCDGVNDVFAKIGGLDNERFLSFLPLSHCYEHTVCAFLATAIGAEVYFAEGIDKISSNLQEVNPTLVTTVPRLCEAIYARIQNGLQTAPPLSRFLFDLALRYGKRKKRHLLEKDTIPTLKFWEILLAPIAYKIINGKMRQRFGGKLRAFVSGGAPLNSDIGIFFLALGIDILQGYGLTETSPVVSFNIPHDNDPRTAGPPMKNTEVKIADDGEILIRGDLLTSGYWNNPEATKILFDADGFLRTGDIGKFDAMGRIMITDRKKNIIITSGGDNVAPQYIEGMLLIHPEIEQVVVFGDKRPALSALLVPEAGWLKLFCAQQQTPAKDISQLRNFQPLREFFADKIKLSNVNLASYEQIRFFDFADEPFSVYNDMLTPSFKIRRHHVIAHYQERLNALYKK